MDYQENIEEAIKNGQSRETGHIGYTRRRQTKRKHITICVGQHYMQINTYNVNTTWILQTTGGKDEPNIRLTDSAFTADLYITITLMTSTTHWRRSSPQSGH